MDVDRAKQIMESAQNIYVTFEGESVWIDNVDDSKASATVHVQDSGKVMQVDLHRLHEQ